MAVFEVSPEGVLGVSSRSQTAVAGSFVKAAGEREVLTGTGLPSIPFALHIESCWAVERCTGLQNEAELGTPLCVRLADYKVLPLSEGGGKGGPMMSSLWRSSKTATRLPRSGNKGH